MADAKRIITFSRGGRPVQVKDLENGSTFMAVKNTFAISAPPRQLQMAQNQRAYGGSRSVGQSHDNATIGWTALVKGNSVDEVLTNIDDLLAELEVAAPGRYVEFRPDGASATKSVFCEIRGPWSWTPTFEWAMLFGAQAMQVAVSVPVAPLGELHRMDICDDFSVDSILDYTFDAGSGTLSVTGGQLVPSDTAEKRLHHSARGYTYSDVQATLKFMTGATIGSSFCGVQLRRTDALTRLQCVTDAGSGNIAIYKVVGGTWTFLAGTAFALATSTTYWIRGRTEGNVVTCEIFTAAPSPMSTPAATASYTLTPAEAAVHGAAIEGPAGIYLLSVPTTWRFDDLSIEPFTYRNRSLPESIPLGGVVPGAAPALADLVITPSGGAAAPTWAMAGWSKRPAVHNLVWNGDFEVDASGWSAAAVTGIHGAGTSILRATTAAKFGVACGEIITPATSDTGASCKITRRFRKGVTYTAEIWARAAASTTSVKAELGQNGDAAAGSAAALTTTWTKYTVTWTPTADRTEAWVAFTTSAATATTMQIDGVMVYEGATAPTLGKHGEGAGAWPPLGIIEAEAGTNLATWAAAVDATASSGNSLSATPSGAGTASAEFVIDPATLAAEDFAFGEIDLEVWARVKLSSTVASPKMTLSAIPDAGTNFGPQRYSQEWGANGKSLTVPLSGTQWRSVRLGTITAVANSLDPAKWRIKIGASWASGSSGTFALDKLTVLPIRSRVLSPSGKALDANFPKFVQSTNETVKRVRSDLSAVVSAAGGASYPDYGLGGSGLIELPPKKTAAGLVDLLVALASLVPDDPTVDATSEQLSHSATVHVAVRPRTYLLAGS